MRIVVLLESFQFSLEIIGVPEEHMIEEFSTNGPDQSLDERVR
jgi:hypothetical protein